MKKNIKNILIILVLVCVLATTSLSILVKSYNVQKIIDLEGCIDYVIVFIVLDRNTATDLGFDSPDIFGFRIKSFNLRFVVFVPGPIMDPIFIA